MRLGQLARKLGISQTEIIRYLAAQNIEIEGGGNVKLEEHHIQQLYAQFAPTARIETKSPADESRQGPSDAVKDSAIDADKAPEPEPLLVSGADEEVLIEEQPDLDATGEVHVGVEPPAFLNTEPFDTIRVPKIELAGLKVLGKIDLPGLKKKEVTPLDEAAITTEGSPEVSEQRHTTAMEATENTVDPERRNESVAGGDGVRKEKIQRDERRGDKEGRGSRNIKSREHRPRKNPIAAQRELELEAERERQKEKAAQEKERRTQNYNKRVKHSPPTKAIRLYEEQVEQLDSSSPEAEPTTWFAKFVKWLRK